MDIVPAGKASIFSWKSDPLTSSTLIEAIKSCVEPRAERYNPVDSTSCEVSALEGQLADLTMNPPAPSSKSALTREEIVAALRAVSDKLGQEGVTGEICLFGGTVMVLAFSARLATKDMDALFQPAQRIREIAAGIGAEQHLPTDWCLR